MSRCRWPTLFLAWISPVSPTTLTLYLLNSPLSSHLIPQQTLPATPLKCTDSLTIFPRSYCSVPGPRYPSLLSGLALQSPCSHTCSPAVSSSFTNQRNPSEIPASCTPLPTTQTAFPDHSHGTQSPNRGQALQALASHACAPATRPNHAPSVAPGLCTPHSLCWRWPTPYTARRASHSSSGTSIPPPLHHSTLFSCLYFFRGLSTTLH